MAKILIWMSDEHGEANFYYTSGKKGLLFVILPFTTADIVCHKMEIQD